MMSKNMETEIVFDKVYNLHPVGIYLNDLKWIQNLLYLTQAITSIAFKYNEPVIFGDITNLEHWAKEFVIDRIDNLKFNNLFCTIEFNSGNTKIKYNSENRTSSRTAKSIYLHLKKRQRFIFFLPQDIFLFDKAIEKNFLLRDKTPVWLNILFWLIPTILSIVALLTK